MTDGFLYELMVNGFMIYPVGEKFVLKKESVPKNQDKIPETLYENYDEAINAAKEMICDSKIFIWTATVRYNRGLGIEYKNLNEISAKTKEEAEQIALELAEKTILDNKLQVYEARVRIKI